MKTTASSFLTTSSRFPAAHFLPSGKQEGPAAGTGATVPMLAGRIQLTKDKIVRLDRSCGVSGISVERGTVWITETPANGDLLAEEGGYVRLRGGWPVVLQALTEVTLVFSGKGSDE